MAEPIGCCDILASAICLSWASRNLSLATPKCYVIVWRICSLVVFWLIYWLAATGDLQSSLASKVAYSQDWVQKVSASSSGVLRKCKHTPLAKNISVWAEWLRQSGRAPSEPSETPLWQITLRPVPIPCVALHIAFQSQFRRFFSRCRYPIVNKYCGVVANCDHTLEWVHWVYQQNVNWSGSHT